MFIFRSEEKRELERAKAKAELEILKFQIQPHFLFNILNSIYAMAITKSEKTPEAILQLSNVMRYVLNETSEDRVLLEKEIGYLQDYIALQLLRTNHNLHFSIGIEGKTQGLKIVPHILVTFVENAFKYGFSTDETSEIRIDLRTEGTMLHFSVSNTLVSSGETLQKSFNIGLKNTKERLQYYFPGKHFLTVKQTDDSFQTSLQIELGS